MRHIEFINLNDKALPATVGLFLVILCLWSETTDFEPIKGFRDGMESLAYDLRLKMTLPETPTMDGRIVMVDIDDQSIAMEGSWPWPRDRLAQLSQNLLDGGAAVVGFDMVFAEPHENSAQQVLDVIRRDSPHEQQLQQKISALLPYFDGDTIFARSLSRGRVVLSYHFHREAAPPLGQLPAPALFTGPIAAGEWMTPSMASYSANVPVLGQAGRYAGFSNIWLDYDGIVRRAPLLLQHDTGLYPSFALEVARVFLGNDPLRIDTTPSGRRQAIENIGVGAVNIPTNSLGQVFIPYGGRSSAFPTISATDVLNNNLPHQALQGAIVLIGVTALGLADLVSTPVQSGFADMEVHATLVAAMLDNAFPVQPAWELSANLTITAIIGVGLALLLPLLGPIPLLCATVTVLLGLLVSNVWLWDSQQWALSVAMQVFLVVCLATVNIAYGFVMETRRRKQLKNMFGQYVPRQLVEQMSRYQEDYHFGGESRVMTVLFADIRNFTTISESLTATELKQLLNRFLTHMTRIIFQHHGTIDKYVGDMIMAFWGAPVHDEHHARHAMAAGLDMLAAAQALSSEFDQLGLPQISIGIGINSGEMNVGDMGSEYRRAYTVLGDNVNLASRLEGLTKYYGVGLVVGENTRHGQDDFVFRLLDRVRVMGKSQAVQVYQPLCPSTESNPQLMAEVRQHQAALHHYFAREWDQAIRLFEVLKAHHPHGNIYTLYLERIEQLRHMPLGDDWDGVYERRAK